MQLFRFYSALLCSLRFGWLFPEYALAPDIPPPTNLVPLKAEPIDPNHILQLIPEQSVCSQSNDEQQPSLIKTEVTSCDSVGSPCSFSDWLSTSPPEETQPNSEKQVLEANLPSNEVSSQHVSSHGKKEHHDADQQVSDDEYLLCQGEWLIINYKKKFIKEKHFERGL
ncbi:hypothetical protein O181_027357 [Austropuccinia psidii MF-1]|uniref:Uncharacterized protein n=1 Tax=Austropuccinia psidii MF-1 TaxID=1389203 RepID=A0A9Q3CPW2_9BASI|nr:hypothetical protein [Austropuccinia psidii MF-1]